MNKKSFTVQPQDKGKRLDVYLFEQLNSSYSRSQLKCFIQQGIVSVSGAIRKPNYQVKNGDSACINFPDIKTCPTLPQQIPLDVVYEDSDIIVINKPSGMVVHPASGNKDNTLVNALLFYTKGKLAHAGSSPRPGIVHRLDKDVSGIMAAAKTDNAYLKLVEGFKKRTVKRTYIAFVEGNVVRDKGCLELPIGRSSRDRKKMAVKFFNAKEASTSFEAIKRFTGYTKLRIQIATGRTHQIRVHMSYMGHPVIGDLKYGGRRFTRIALYAAELEFSHPRTGKKLLFKVDMPNELKELDGNAIYAPDDTLR
jgi:23S rRNA pseudouridine1911/1915/1917 synthase